MDLYVVYVSWLKNPSSMPADVAQQFQTLGFTNSDYQTILAQDPFANGSTTIDNSRFALTTTSFPYEPPLQLSDCNAGVCTCSSWAGTVKNEYQTNVSSQAENQSKVGVSVTAGYNSVFASASLTASNTLTWTNTSSQANTTDSSQSATVTVSCPSSNYQGPTEMQVYWDLLYGAFMFVPYEIPTDRLFHGFAVDKLGNKIPHELVTLTYNGKTYHTFTDGNGEYKFAMPNVGDIRRAAQAKLAIRGVEQSVKLEVSETPAEIRIK
jgi:hypothetical protein